MNPAAAFKPSDIFFNPPPEQNRGAATPNNNKGADFIIARDIEIRGWLINPSLNADGAFEFINGNCEKRMEDFHYDIIPDLEWMLDPAKNPTLSQLVGAGFPGHGSFRDYVICPADDLLTPDCLKCTHGITTQRLPFEDLGPNGLSIGFTPNSFLLPGNRVNPVSRVPQITVELNVS